MNATVEILNRRLGERLGLVCGGSVPRFAWKYAPDQPRFVYDTDNRTLLKKTWADAPAPDGATIGKVWFLAEWRRSRAVDHYGFSDAVRVPLVKDADYVPYLETALAPEMLPTEALTQNYIFALDHQLQRAAEHDPNSFNNYMAEEKFTADRNKRRDAEDWRESARRDYDDNTGAMGNCLPGTRGGFLSFGGIE